MKDFAFVVSCNPFYDFGLLSSMIAQEKRGTNADWEIAYEDFTDERIEKISDSFSANVNWTPIADLLPLFEDKRTDKRYPLNRFWVAYWLLAYKLLKEKKYKAVCVTQADQFLNMNLDIYFNMAYRGFVSCTEYPFNFLKAEDMPYGRDLEIWDRGQCAFFDSACFVGQEHKDMVFDCVALQAEDAFRGESNGSIPAMNRSICRHLKKDQVLSLEGRTWVCDSIWHETKLVHQEATDRIYRDRGILINGWHCRWWQEGRVTHELNSFKSGVASRQEIENCLHNYNFTKKYMEDLFLLKPGLEAEDYVKGDFKWEE